jgi:predicted nucleotidyltransferase
MGKWAASRSYVRQITIFGSRVRRDHTQASDLDMLKLISERRIGKALRPLEQSRLAGGEKERHIEELLKVHEAIKVMEELIAEEEKMPR